MKQSGLLLFLIIFILFYGGDTLAQHPDSAIRHVKLVKDSLYNSSQRINLIYLGRENLPDWGIEVVQQGSDLLMTSTLAEAHGAIAAINGSFFDRDHGGSVCYFEKDDSVISRNRTPGIKWAVPDSIINAALILHRDSGLLVEYLKSELDYELSGKEDFVLASGPMLILDSIPQKLPAMDFSHRRHPRTCMGFTGDSLILITIDGRSEQAAGMSLKEVQDFLLSLGCVDAINLDGGGSTTMWIRHRGIVNHPSDKSGERPVANALIVRNILAAKDQEENFDQVRKIFYKQEADWNRGDLDAFMEAYWRSEDLQFGGADGITRGWQQTLDRYKKGYPDRESMGKLSFQIKDMTQHSEDVISLTGSWELERKKDKPGGHFLLIWRKIDGDWKIVADHTSQRMEPSSRTLAFLHSISGKRTLAGQHNKEPNDDPDRWTRFIKETTGVYPALWSGDFLFQQENIDSRWKMIHEAKTQWDRGAVINLMWHACPPDEGEPCSWDPGLLNAQLSDEQWEELLTDGTALNGSWKARMDDLAVYLQFLEDKGVEVLFRPFHEMNQGLFWWGGRPGPGGTAQLYRITHDYFTLNKGLDNLIWVWDMQDLSRDFADYNPGAQYWDVFGFDIYDRGYEQSWYQYILSIAGNKPMAIGECARLPGPGVLEEQPRWVFFMPWAELVKENNTEEQIIELYRHPAVITLDEMPGWSK